MAERLTAEVASSPLQTGASMANDEHVALLKQGVAAWNAWRAENRNIRPNLSGAHLSEENLRGADLSTAILRGAVLRAAKLGKANLRLANLSETDLRWANLSKAKLGQWLGRAAVLVEATGDTFGKIALTNAAQWLGRANRDLNAQTIATVVYQALAKAKLAAPAALQGTFIIAGHTFDAYAAVSKVLGTATTDLLMIDPYADAKILQYAVSAPKQVSVRILADQDPPLPAVPSARSGTMGAAVPLNSPSVCAAGSSQHTS